MSTIKVQGPASFGGFSHAGATYAADEDGIIEIPAHVPNEVLAAHGIKHAPAKPAPKPLAKAAKGGVPDEPPNLGGVSIDDGEPVKKGVAKAAKGGAE
jgi:hypothetical protein